MELQAKATPSASPPTTPSTAYNTSLLPARLAIDFLSAFTAASLVAPVISVIDRSVMENASGANTLAGSLRASLRTLLLRPHTLILARPFAYIAMVYGGTYLTANTLDTAVATKNNLPASHVTSGTAKFVASSAANVGLGVYKDQAFVRMFGPPGVVPRAVPLASYAFFTLRDCLTIFASFNVPPMLGPYLNLRMSDRLRRRVEGATVAQFVAPAVVQTLSTPLHLWGLDLYNTPSQRGGVGVVTARDRWLAVRKNWAVSVVARICRIMPAFGVGGVVNTKMRKSLMAKLE